MSEKWLHIIGIGEDGLDGLNAAALQALQQADVIIGGDRHHVLSAEITAKRLKWPSPFDAMIDVIQSYKGQRLAILVTGDPLWYSVGARIMRAVSFKEICFHPQLSAFQWAAVRMGWSMADCDTLTIHGRADSQILPFLAPFVKLLVLTQNGESPALVARLLVERGFGQSKMTVLAALGGAREQRFEGSAHDWAHEVPDFHTLAIECIADEGSSWFGRTGGLPDHAFISDGQITKQDVRAVTLAKLMPYPDALLWDVGAGCGSISVEWMRAARGAQAIAIEHKPERCTMIEHNKKHLGVEKMTVVTAKAPQGLQDLPTPDAVFLGGGINTPEVFDQAWQALRAGGRLVANAVTLEGENKLAELHHIYGGELVRLAVQKVETIGQFRGWKAAMPVTQWNVQKPFESKT